MASSTRETARQLKVIRSLTRLKYSLDADDAIADLIEQREQVGAAGAVPQLETTLAEILAPRDDS